MYAAVLFVDAAPVRRGEWFSFGWKKNKPRSTIDPRASAWSFGGLTKNEPIYDTGPAIPPGKDHVYEYSPAILQKTTPPDPIYATIADGPSANHP